MIRRSLAVFVLSAVVLAACGPYTQSAAESASAAMLPGADSARGVIAVTGSEPYVRVQLIPAHQPGVMLTLTGSAATSLRELDGLEVMVRGRRLSRSDAVPQERELLEVDRFIVRGSGGVAAVDGVLLESAGRFQLALTEGGRVDVPHLPPALRDAVGRRVYLVGPLVSAPSAYGRIP